MKKLFILIFLCIPTLALSQNLEIGVSGGASINTVPNDRQSEYVPSLNPSGVNPYLSIHTNYLVDNLIKIGLSVSYLSASAEDSYRGKTSSGKLFSPLFQVMPEVLYSFGNDNFTFDAGVQFGIVVYSAHGAEVGMIKIAPIDENGDGLTLNYGAGIILRASRKLTKSLYLTLALNPIYNHFRLSENIDRIVIPADDNHDYSFITIPLSVGLSFRI